MIKYLVTFVSVAYTQCLILDCFAAMLLVSGDKPQVCIPDLALHAAQFN